jgi:uncharacterized protein (TIGR03435 family)
VSAEASAEAQLDCIGHTRTGIAGTFDIHLDLTSDDLFPFARHDDAPAVADAAPSDPLGAITLATQKLGLKLEATRVSTEVIAIEHVERPSEN